MLIVTYSIDLDTCVNVL